MRNGTIRPNRRGVDNITLPVSPQGEYGYTWEWSGVGQYGHMVTPGSGSGGNQVDVPAGAFLDCAPTGFLCLVCRGRRP
jgi:hypothetical protein